MAGTAYRMTEDEFIEAVEAEDAGRAMPLIDCDRCEGARRGVVREFVTARGSDPTRVYVLSCGHEVL